MSEEPIENQVEEPPEDDDLRPRFKPLNAVGIVMMLAAIGIALWQAEQDNRAIMEARQRQEAVQGGIPKSKPEFPIDINNATARELEFLPGIGETYAREIVRLREKQGPFSSVDDLKQISGIGEKTVDGIRGLTRVTAQPATGESEEKGLPSPGDDKEGSSSGNTGEEN